MNIVGPYAKIMDLESREDGIRLLRKIEWCARVSHASEDAQTTDSWDRFIRSVVLTHGDWSVVEHAFLTVDFLIDRGISHELVRHRLFSYTQSSTRFINYEKKMPPSFVVPPDLTQGQRSLWEVAMHQAESNYRSLIQAGQPPQIARSVFPNSLATRIVTTGNLRNWRHLLLMRTTRETHPQFRQISLPLLEEFKSKIPILFEDIEPLAKQSDNLKKMR